MNLRKMTSDEFDFWNKRSLTYYADEKMKANSLSRKEAEKISEDDFKRYLPDGFSSENNYLFTAINDDDSIVGYIWFVIRGQKHDCRAFICDVIIEKEFRGKGYGKKIMTLIEKEVIKAGTNRIGLHVFGHNKIAIGLYQSIGYITTDLVMEKTF